MKAAVYSIDVYSVDALPLLSLWPESSESPESQARTHWYGRFWYLHPFVRSEVRRHTGCSSCEGSPSLWRTTREKEKDEEEEEKEALQTWPRICSRDACFAWICSTDFRSWRHSNYR